MKSQARIGILLAIVACLACVSVAQAAKPAIIPPFVKFDGVLADGSGKPLKSLVGVTFALYKDFEGGAPLWLETQNVQPDSTGHYSVMLGSTKPTGISTDLFASGEAHWLGVRPEGHPEGARILLVAVPFAMKAGDAETIGGLPPSAFMLAPVTAAAATTQTTAPPATSEVALPALGGTGTPNTLPIWTNSTTLGSSVITQTGAAATAKVGINTTTPAATLDVKGTSTLRGLASMPATAVATAAAGKASQPIAFTASVFNSSSSAPVNENFRLQAEPVGNNTATATGSMNLLFGQGTAAPTETGLKFGSNGLITFAPGQTFPGAGSGTITGVTAGSGLTGGGSSGAVTLNVDAGKVPLLAANNTFTADQTMTGNLNVAGYLTSTTLVGIAAYFQYPNDYSVLVGINPGQGQGMEVDSTGTGITAISTNYHALDGISRGSTAILGETSADLPAIVGESQYPSGGIGVYATSESGGQGLWGQSNGNNFFNGAGPDGVHGVATGASGSGVAGINTASGGIGVYGAVYDNASLAGRFDGNVFVNGTLSKSGGSFKIDDPLDPANKYLSHSFVESPDMMNIYNGNVTTDSAGEAVVNMPQWFDALNREFRYQLTVMGQFAQAIVGREMENGQFQIRTDKPNVKVSWQVTGIRHDAWANAHRIPVEEEKSAGEQGTYLHPELFGAPKEAGLSWKKFHYPDVADPKKIPHPQATIAPKSATKRAPLVAHK